MEEKDIVEEKDIIDVEFYESKNLPSTEVKDIQVDIEFQYARNNIINIIEKSEDVLNNTAKLAIECDHPKMIEVYSGLIKNLVDINKSIFEIREKKMKIKGELQDKEEVPQNQHNNTNITNAVFVGSSEELLQTMKNN